MTFFYTQTQADDIAYVWANHGIPEAYLLAADYADGQLGVSPDVVEWLRGAASINGNSGYFNDFVRGYSSDQFEARYGHAPDTSGPNSIQGASDAIATTILGQITTTGELPILSEIADDDAEPAATALFGGDAGGWAGNSMFLGLGYDAPLFANILETSGDTYDALAMIKFTRDNAAFPGAESIFDYGVSTLGHGVTIAGFSGLIDRDGGLGSEQ